MTGQGNLRAALDTGLETALDAYIDYAGQRPRPDEDDADGAKKVQSFHAACRAALQHVEMLVRLRRAVGPEAADDADTESLMAGAEAEAAEHGDG